MKRCKICPQMLIDETKEYCSYECEARWLRAELAAAKERERALRYERGVLREKVSCMHKNQLAMEKKKSNDI